MKRFDILLLILFFTFSYLAWLFLKHWHENRNLSDVSKNFQKQKNLNNRLGNEKININKRSLIATIICMPIILLFIRPQYSYNNYQHPHIKSPDFIQPIGCPKTVYRWPDDNIILKSCLVDRFPDNLVQQYGLHIDGRGPHPYYRVGNDLIEVSCTMWNEPNECDLVRIEKNSYYQ